MRAAERLLGAIREAAGKRRRVPLEGVWQAFRDALPVEYADRGRVGLAEHLHTLAAEGALRLPAQRSTTTWDRSVQPPLPSWVELAPAGAPAEAIDHRMIAWPPELARLVDEPRLRPELLGEFMAIQRFLAASGRTREPVPARERSVELFGDEKRLDVFMTSLVARRVGVTLELLRAFAVPVPIVWEAGPAAAEARATSLLVLENLHTYDSFRRWNARSGAYLAIVYGGGKAFAGMLDDLTRIAVELGATEVDYFGDLDVEGLRIPAAAAHVLDARGLPLRPALPWYDALLARGDASHARASEPLDDRRILAWLPERLCEPVEALLVAGRRLPQELVGWELLVQLLSPT